MTLPPLGIPGAQPGKSPSLANDRASRVRRSFSYQDYAAFNLICASLKNGEYEELWMEHHDDIVAVRPDRKCDVYQIKTRETEDKKWKIGDTEITKIIQRFAHIERMYGEKINAYYIYSNTKQYIPAEHTSNDERTAESLSAIKQAINDDLRITPTVQKSINRLLSQTGTDISELKTILKKLYFKEGESLIRFRESSHSDLANVDPRLRQWSISDLIQIQQLIIDLIERASSVDVPPIYLNTSSITNSGLSEAEINIRQVHICDAKNIINNHIQKKKIKRISIALFGVMLFLGGIIALRPVVWKSNLDQAVDTIKNANSNVLPADFKEAVSIIRSAHKPLIGIQLANAELACQDLSDLDLRRMFGPYLKGTGINFDKTILSMAVLTGSELNTAKFRYAQMDSIQLDEANMLAANLFGAEARYSNFQKATLQGANLSHSNFSGSDFSNAKLNFAELIDSDLSDAEFYGTELTDANISGTVLLNAKNLTQSAINSACSNPQNPPILSASLKPPKRACFSNEKEKFERKLKRAMIGFVGANIATLGYCKKNSVEYRPPDSKLHPQNNINIWVDLSDLDDPSPIRK